MYVTGDITNYQSRIHQLPTGVSDINLFVIEGKNYLTSIPYQISGAWDFELRRKKGVFLQSGIVNPILLL